MYVEESHRYLQQQYLGSTQKLFLLVYSYLFLLVAQFFYYITLHYILWVPKVVLVVKNLNEGDLRDMDSILRSGRSPRGGHDRVQQTHKYYGKICEILKVEPCVPLLVQSIPGSHKQPFEGLRLLQAIIYLPYQTSVSALINFSVYLTNTPVFLPRESNGQRSLENDQVHRLTESLT